MAPFSPIRKVALAKLHVSLGQRKQMQIGSRHTSSRRRTRDRQLAIGRGQVDIYSPFTKEQ